MNNVMKVMVAVLTFSLTPMVAAWGASDELEDVKARLAIIEERLDRLEAYRIMDRHVCTDEREEALAYTTQDTSDHAVPALWNGTPFIVDISSTFNNAEQLIEVVAEEAERIREFLGHEIFVAGNVLPLDDILYIASNAPHSTFRELMPPDQHIEIRCCSSEPDTQGVAYPSWRIITLSVTHAEHAAVPSRHAIIHELYHLLGYVHPGDSLGVVMSTPLMHGDDEVRGWVTVDGRRGWYPTTRSTPADLAKLACIYD